MTYYSRTIAEMTGWDEPVARVVEVVIRGTVPTLDHLTRPELHALAVEAFGDAIELAAMGLLEPLCQGECEVPAFFKSDAPVGVFCDCGGQPGQHTPTCAMTPHLATLKEV